MAGLLKRSALLRSLGPETFRFAFRSIKAQKLRSFLTLLGILAGVATVIAMVSFVSGFNVAITGAFASSGTDLVQFQKFEPRFGGPPELVPEEQKRRRSLTLEDAAALKRLATLAAAVSPERDLLSSGDSVTVKNRQGDEANGPVILGVTPDYAVANNRSVDDGRFLTATDLAHEARVCLIGADLVKALFPNRDPVGREVLIQGMAFQVVGVLEQRGSQFGGSGDSLLLIPMPVFDSLFPQVKNGNGDTLHIATVPREPRLLQALIWLKDIRDRDAMNEVWKAWLPADGAPARACVQASLADARHLVEIMVTACK